MTGNTGGMAVQLQSRPVSQPEFLITGHLKGGELL